MITPLDIVPTDRDLNYVGSLVDGLAVLTGDRIRASLFGARSADFKVAGTVPPGPVVIRPTTILEVGRCADQGKAEGSGPDSILREHRRTEARASSDPRNHRAAVALSGGL